MSQGHGTVVLALRELGAKFFLGGIAPICAMLFRVECVTAEATQDVRGIVFSVSVPFINQSLRGPYTPASVSL
jgi:hypothetical protein